MPMDPSRPLQDRVALVTGSSGGIGEGLVRAMAEAGAKVVVTYHSNEGGARTIADEIEARGGEAMVAALDASDEESVEDVFARTVERFGRVDCAVANAGAQHDAAFADMTLADWRAVIDLDLTGQFLTVREAVRHMRDQEPSEGARARGAIVCISSVHDTIPWAGHVNYAASKGGVQMMMRSVAQEVAGGGIRVNSIAPGAIATSINEDVWGDEEKRAKLMDLIPYGRIGEAEDVARLAVWLLSDAADYIVGQTITIDGGMSLYPGFIGNG